MTRDLPALAREYQPLPVLLDRLPLLQDSPQVGIHREHASLLILGRTGVEPDLSAIEVDALLLHR